jgi:PD-(D/E)XK nuclease superfamily
MLAKLKSIRDKPAFQYASMNPFDEHTTPWSTNGDVEIGTTPPQAIYMDIEQSTPTNAVADVVTTPRRVGRHSFNAADVHQDMTEIFKDVYKRHGSTCSESLYQKAIVRRAYLDAIPTMNERELFADRGDGSLLIGRIDIEVAGICLYELKVGQPNIAKDKKQINTYLACYDLNGEAIQIAALVYFTPSGVFIHEVRNDIMRKKDRG